MDRFKYSDRLIDYAYRYNEFGEFGGCIDI